MTLNLSNPLNLCAIKRKVHLFGPDDSPRLNECARLRYTYFVQKRGWVAPNPVYPDVEQDSYDEHCLHLGVWDNKGVTAYLRALPFDFHIGFMLDHDLSCLIENEDQKTLLRDGAVELSRLVVRPDIVFCQADPHPVEMLLRLLYREAKMRGFRRFYIVVEEGWLRPFERRFGLPFRVIGAPYLFPDGTKTIAAMATLEELESGMRRHSEAKYTWYQEEERDVP